ncbi:MAG TPA: DUF427 domain-containing protein [Solirubrobacteraceae bacterium]|nr:DUF427 domain-containing protein [Solirubrobacteraceae bacterium]
MGLAWQQGPLATGSVGRFLVAEPLPQRLLYAEPLRRRMRVKFDGEWIADSEDVVLLHEPARYPVAYFPKADIAHQVLNPAGRTTEHQDLGPTSWYAVRHGDHESPRGAWEHTALPAHADILAGRVAFAWHAMDGFYEEEERVLGHASDAYHRIDIRQTARRLTVQVGERRVAETDRALVLFESGFAPRWYVPREDVAADALTPVDRQTFCPYKGLCSYFDVAGVSRAVWAYLEPYREVDRIAGYVSFEPDKVTVTIDGGRLHAEPGQNVVSHGPDRGLTVDEAAPARPRTV